MDQLLNKIASLNSGSGLLIGTLIFSTFSTIGVIFLIYTNVFKKRPIQNATSMYFFSKNLKPKSVCLFFSFIDFIRPLVFLNSNQFFSFHQKTHAISLLQSFIISTFSILFVSMLFFLSFCLSFYLSVSLSFSS